MAEPRPSRCVECGIALVPKMDFTTMTTQAREGRAGHGGLGLCVAHYMRVKRRRRPGFGQPRRKVVDRAPQIPLEVVLEEWDHLRAGGVVLLSTAAERIGMNREALAAALRRARAKGDERAYVPDQRRLSA